MFDAGRLLLFEGFKLNHESIRESCRWDSSCDGGLPGQDSKRCPRQGAALARWYRCGGGVRAFPPLPLHQATRRMPAGLGPLHSQSNNISATPVGLIQP